MSEEKLDQPKEKEMSFLDHLEELRWHLVRSGIVVVVFAVVIFVFQDYIFKNIIFAPTSPDFWTFQRLCDFGNLVKIDFLCIEEFPFEIQSRKMMGQFMMAMTVAFVGGFLAAFPYIFWEVWRFIAPGLYSHERKVSRGAVFFVTLLFSLGVAFGYFIVTPVAINFFANYSVYEEVKNQFDITNYVTTVVILVLGSGILFQLPIVVYFLSKIGIVTPQLMKKYRRHAIVAIFILAAMITPPDPFTMVFVGIPLVGLYQISILISAWIQRKNKKAELQKYD